MSKKFSGLETHLVFCPNFDMAAQIRTGEYIASLKPASVILGSRLNNSMPPEAAIEVQGFYDSITGYDNPAKRHGLPNIPGVKSFASVYEMIAETQGKDKLAATVIEAGETIGAQVHETIPYYHTAMQLRDTKIPFLTADLANGGDSVHASLINAAVAGEEAESVMFETPGGIEKHEVAIRAFREALRSQADTIKGFIRSSIKKAPSRATAHNQKNVLVIDNPLLYSLRKEQPSKQVKTIIKCFSSQAIVEGCAGRKQVMACSDFQILGGLVVEHGIHIPPEVDERIGLTDRVVGLHQTRAIIDYLGLGEEKKLFETILAYFYYIKGKEQSVRYAQAVNRAGHTLNRMVQEGSLADDDYEKHNLLTAGFLKQLLDDMYTAVAK